MRLKNIAIYMFALLLSLGVAFGEEREFIASGQVLRSPTFNPTDAINLSQYNNGFGTAKYMSMGGAFTSLGADMTSGHLNPAGLGMYQTSEFSFTPSITISDVSNKNAFDGDNSKTRFGINNVGMAFNMYQGSGDLTSFTMAISYNKLADYNYRSSLGVSGTGSISDAFIRQLYGYDSNGLLGDTPWFGDRNHPPMPPSFWPAIMGFKTFLIDNPEIYNDKGEPTGTYNRFEYFQPGIGPNTKTKHFSDFYSKGRTGEFSIAAGFNIQNKLYIGLGVGIVNYYQDQELIYTEEFTANDAWEPHTAYQMSINRRFTGNGVNFKFGMIYNPVGGLRLGAAVHTPTFASTKFRYSIEATAWGKRFDDKGDLVSEKEEVLPLPPFSRQEQDFNTPTRLMLGASYTFGTRGLLSVDYERTWYNGIKSKSGIRSDKNFFRNDIKYIMQASNSLRVGGEIRPTNILYLRGGFIYNGEMTNSNIDINKDRTEIPISYKSYGISGGIGVHLGRYTMLDFTYSFFSSKNTSYDLYYYETNSDPYEKDPGIFYDAYAGNISSSLKRHFLTLSLGWRF